MHSKTNSIVSKDIIWDSTKNPYIQNLIQTYIKLITFFLQKRKDLNLQITSSQLF